MRHLTYSETALSLLVIAVLSALAYLVWFQPALDLIAADRQATWALLFELAAAPREEKARAPTAVSAMAFKPESPAIVVAKPKVRSRVRAPIRAEALELDEGTDPISGLEVKD